MNEKGLILRFYEVVKEINSETNINRNEETMKNLACSVSWDICVKIMHMLRGLRARNAVPIGKENRKVQYETAIKYCLAKNKFAISYGKILLSDLSEETISAISNISNAEEDKINVWLL